MWLSQVYLLTLPRQNRPGARFGPRSIRQTFSQLSWARLDDWGFDAFDKLAVIDYGDCELDHGFLETIPSDIREHVTEIISADVGLLSLGGDHFHNLPHTPGPRGKIRTAFDNPFRRPFGYLGG